MSAPWRRVFPALTSLGDAALFWRDAGYWLLPRWARRRRGRLPPREVFVQLDRLGIRILPLLSVVLFFVGMILALQLATILAALGVIEYVADIVGVSMVREMAPLLTGVVLSGFAGAAIAAELGSMKVSEELTAMETLALDPTRCLVAPRLLAAAITGPLIATFAMYIGLAGGLAVSALLLGLPPGQFLQRACTAIGPTDVLLGLTKGLVFSLLVVGIACHEGARTAGGALGVGRATTAAVVKSIVAIIAADLVLTVLFFNLE